MTEKKSEAEKVQEYIKTHNVSFDELSEDSKKAVSLMYNRINTVVSWFIDYDLNPRITTLEERVPSTRVYNVNSLNKFVDETSLCVVDFWSQTCIPCALAEPVFEKLSKEFVGVRFGRVNIDENPRDMKKYEILKIPTLLWFKNGVVVDRQVGTPPTLPELETLVREKTLGMTAEEFQRMLAAVQKVAEVKGWRVVENKKVRDMLIHSLVMNKINHGFPYCPCRPFIKGKKEYNKKIICPCVFSEAEIKRLGHCYCQLFWNPQVNQKPKSGEVEKHIKKASRAEQVA